MLEFGLTIGLLMALVVVVAQLAIVLSYRSSLELAAREGAFEASLAGHQLNDGEIAAGDLWHRLEPGAGQVQVTAVRQGNLVVVTASASAPAVVPLPFPPFTHWPLQVRAVHTVERFQAGSS